ncbi:MAG TPA: cell envelope integrity EipB family protein [Afifellaceae bacterium]|nr:cell envelope integrity EipB family protein [Afifellaceae bacterium]
MKSNRPIPALAALPLAGLLAAAAPQPGPLAVTDAPVPHRAVYEIGLAESQERSGVTNASGRMVFEVAGSACEGYTMTQRMVVRLGDTEGDDRLLDFRVSTFESGDGALYRFSSRTYINDRVVEEVTGLAERTGRGIQVKLQNPDEKTLRLAEQALFPSQHLHAILAAARAERHFVSAEIYEGAGKGESADTATAVIGGPEKAAGSEPVTGGKTRWPVSIAYFDNEPDGGEASGEQTPTYQMSFLLYENGVTRDLLMDYGDYALSGKLESIDALEPSPCDEQPGR